MNLAAMAASLSHRKASKYLSMPLLPLKNNYRRV